MTFTQHNHNGVVYMTSPNIKTTHAFTTRFGGVSSGIFSTLNLGLNLDDEPDNLKENYRRLCDAINISVDDIVFSNQVHEVHVRTVSDDECGKLFIPGKPQADGLVTDKPGVALMVFIADCVPILLHDSVARVIGAVHAGWRGTAYDIAGVAVKKMIVEFGCNPKNIHAAIGPCISMCCYEVGNDVADAIKETLGGETLIAEQCIRHLTQTNGHDNEKYSVDLKMCNRLMLARAGVCDILMSDECTCCSNDKYWSHRFTSGKRGSQVAIITTGCNQ